MLNKQASCEPQGPNVSTAAKRGKELEVNHKPRELKEIGSDEGIILGTRTGNLVCIHTLCFVLGA